MSNPSGQQKRILRELPDITAARQEESIRQFRDTVRFYNEQMGNLGLCDGNRCKWHQVVPGTGTSRDMCRCKRAGRARTVQERKFWERMHFENCSAGRSMEKNLGCRGFEMEGQPLYNQQIQKKLYQEQIQGRKVI